MKKYILILPLIAAATVAFPAHAGKTTEAQAKLAISELKKEISTTSNRRADCRAVGNSYVTVANDWLLRQKPNPSAAYTAAQTGKNAVKECLNRPSPQ